MSEGDGRSVQLPLDILHVSDLHFRAKEDPDRQAHFDALIGHVQKAVESQEFRPALIACTGDLVEGPYFRSGRAFRRSVQALLDLAHACGFLGYRVAVDFKGPLPSEWESLLYDRILIVPGNHDLYARGLRLLYLRRRNPWREIAAPSERHRKDLQTKLVASAKTFGPLHIQFLDSNGPGVVWGSARQEVVRPLNLKTPESDYIGLVLLHGHPIQLPFLLEGVTGAERALLLENAGLLLKNLVAKGIRLVLHGHRHYPGRATLVAPHPSGYGRPITVVGAGSVTRPPKGLRYSSFNWVRIHPDKAVEVTEARKRVGDEDFILEPSYFAEHGDFCYDRVEKEVRIFDKSGDAEVRMKVTGFRIIRGREEVSHIPLRVPIEKPSGLAGFHVDVHDHQTEIRWGHGRGVLEILPPRSSLEPPLNFSIRYFLHNTMALTDWEAKQLWGDEGYDREHTDIQPACSVCSIGLRVRFPKPVYEHLVLRADDRKGQACWVEVDGAEGSERITLSEKTQDAWYEGEVRMSRRLRRMIWKLPGAQDIPLKVRKELELIRNWQRHVIEKHRAGETTVDHICKEIAADLRKRFELSCDTSLWVPGTSDLTTSSFQATPAALFMVGSSSRPRAKLQEYQLPFGAGVGGRALRLGTPLLYDRVKAEASVDDYSKGKNVLPSNFLHSLGPRVDYQGLLAIPVLPDAEFLPPEWHQAPSRYVLAVLCISSKGIQSPLLDWTEAEIQSILSGWPLAANIAVWADELEKARLSPMGGASRPEAGEA